jgi:hypothetical protein
LFINQKEPVMAYTTSSGKRFLSAFDPILSMLERVDITSDTAVDAAIDEGVAMLDARPEEERSDDAGLTYERLNGSINAAETLVTKLRAANASGRLIAFVERVVKEAQRARDVASARRWPMQEPEVDAAPPPAPWVTVEDPAKRILLFKPDLSDI